MAKVAVLGSYPNSLINFRGLLLAELVASGNEVHALAPDAKDNVIEALKKLGVRYHNAPISRTGMNPLSDLIGFLKLIGLFKRLAPDVLFAYTIKPVIYGTLAAKLSGVKHIYSMITGVGYTLAKNNTTIWPINIGIRFLYRLALKCNSKVFFQNPDNLEMFKERRLLCETRKAVLVNGSGVDLVYFSPAPCITKPHFLMIARLLRDKGIYEYVNAARIVKIHYPEARFRLAGWIDENPSAISKYELDNWVNEGVIEYLGYLEDVRTAISNASIYVLPSYHEGLPRTVLEAMAMGKPLISTDVPGCRETVKVGENGFLVHAGNSDALADAMIRFIRDPNIIPAMGAASLRLAQERFDVRKINKILLKSMGLQREASF